MLAKEKSREGGIILSDNWVVQNLEKRPEHMESKAGGNLAANHTGRRSSSKAGRSGTSSWVSTARCRAIGLALPVLFFVIGVMRTCGSLAETKRPETALKLFIRFALAKGIVTYGLQLMMALFQIVQGLVSTIMNAAGFGTAQQTVLPQEIVTAVESCGFFESIPLWAVTLIGGLFITVLSFLMIMTVY